VIDDASRYAIALDGIGTTRAEAVRERLETAFTNCGLPDAMLMDHGTPWWNVQTSGGWTQLTVWLMKQGIQLYFSGIRHPQTQGKVERFHGALELARRRRGLPEPALHQRWLDDFRQEYNHLRPHEALGMKTQPASGAEANGPINPIRTTGTILPVPSSHVSTPTADSACRDGTGRSVVRSPESASNSSGSTSVSSSSTPTTSSGNSTLLARVRPRSNPGQQDPKCKGCPETLRKECPET
jgi:hypothetical protein